MNLFLRLESIAILAGAVVVNLYVKGDWPLFILFAILPELTLLAFLQRDPRAWWPALTYNLAHSYVLPVLAAFVLYGHAPYFLLGWAANISLNRALGLGFRKMRRSTVESPSQPKPTHPNP
jgi:hypothetical protein